MVKMKKIIIMAFFSLIFCQGLCYAGNSLSVDKEKKISEEKKLLSIEIKKLKIENQNLEKELAGLKNINGQLEEKAKEFYIKAKDCGDKSRELENLNSLLGKMNQERISFKNENEKLYNDITALKDAAKKEYAALYEELGTAYTQAKLYDNAIKAYEKSLVYDQRNADVYYYLGLLYKHSGKNDKKAIFNLKQYLKYNPGAKNKNEIQYLIDMLKDEF